MRAAATGSPRCLAYGLSPTLRGARLRREHAPGGANACADAAAQIALVCVDLGIPFAIEQPELKHGEPHMFRLPSFEKLVIPILHRVI